MRNNLPFREKTELFLITPNGNILAEDHGTYIMFPGGWIDDNEINITESALRELREETWMTTLWKIIPFTTVSWKWFPAWADNKKRKERYKQFLGERVHMLCWSACSDNIKLSVSEDSWKNTDGLSPEVCIQKVLEYAKNDHVNTYSYRVAQVAAIRAAALSSWNPIYQNTVDVIFAK